MATSEMGVLTEVEDISNVWEHEAQDFTPWLADNLELLGGAIGHSLELTGTEVPVGGFKVDIVAESEGVGRVVIENQLEVADHKHLGQLLTYAAGQDARALVWVTTDFRDEHRAALDWLNRWTSAEIGVYGVEVRAVQIGDSLPAPEFSVVAAPSDLGKSAAGTESSSLKDRYLEFFTPIYDELISRGAIGQHNPRPDKSQKFRSAAEDSRIYYRIRFWRKEETSVHLWIGTKDENRNRLIFDALHKSKDAIEDEVGSSLSWERKQGANAAIRAFGTGSIHDSEGTLREVQRHMVDSFLALRSALDSRLPSIIEQLDESSEAEESGGVESELLGNRFD